jgi:hypothetical protein
VNHGASISLDSITRLLVDKALREIRMIASTHYLLMDSCACAALAFCSRIAACVDDRRVSRRRGIRRRANTN